MTPDELPQPLAPLHESQWDARLSGAAAALGTPLNIHRLLAHHPALLLAWLPFRDHVVRDSMLSARQRELVILRTAYRRDADYEWHHHVGRAAAAGITAGEIEACRQGADAFVDGVERALIEAVDELLATGRLSAATAMSLSARIGQDALLDVIMTVGAYTTLALLLRTFEVPIETGGSGHPREDPH